MIKWHELPSLLFMLGRVDLIIHCNDLCTFSEHLWHLAIVLVWFVCKISLLVCMKYL